MNNFVVMRFRNRIIKRAVIEDDPFEVPSIPKDLSPSLVGNDLTVTSTREKPQQPPSAYIMWLKSKGLQAVKQKYPNSSFAETGAHAGAAWAKLDTSVKEWYEVEFKKSNEWWLEQCRIWHKVGNKYSQLDTIAEPTIDSSQSKDDDNLLNKTNDCPKIVHSREEKLTGTDVNTEIIDSVEEVKIKLSNQKLLWR